MTSREHHTFEHLASESELSPGGSFDAEKVGWLYRTVSLFGILMAAGGIMAELYLVGDVRRGMWPMTELVGALLSSEPSAWTTLGIWTLIAGPILALISMFVGALRRRAAPAALLSGSVLGVIVLSVPVKLWLQGGL